MDKQEKIVCAAIRFAIPKEDYTGVKIVTGVDYRSIVNDGVLKYLAHGEMTNIWKKGFITNHNRFVDAKEAKSLALRSKDCIFWIADQGEKDAVKEIAKLYKKRNLGGDVTVQLAINMLHEKIERFIEIKNEFNSRDYLKPEDLY